MKNVFFTSCFASLIICSCVTNGNTNTAADSNTVKQDTGMAVMPSQAAGNTIAGRWNLIPAMASDTTTGRLPYLVFDTSLVSGNTGCNNFSGGYKQTGSSLNFDANMVSTKMACVGYDEAAFVKNLLRITSYEVKGDTLVLKADATPVSYWLKGR